MGASCTCLRQDDDGLAPSSCVFQPHLHRRIQSANGLRNQILSSNQDVRSIQQTLDGQLTTPNKIVPLQNQDHQLAEVDDGSEIGVAQNQISSSDQDVKTIQQVLDGQLTSQPMAPSKIVSLHNQEHQPAVSVDGGLTQGDEPIHSLKSNSESSPSVDYQIKSPDVIEEPLASEPLIPVTDDEDFCPTCLDGYNEDNPKIVTKCKHHYHLSCILEWMERSNTCPICDQDMIFNEK